VKPLEIVLLLALPIACGVRAAWWARVPAWPSSARVRTATVVTCVSIVLGLPLAHVGTHETLTGFAASALRFYAETREADAAAAFSAPYPLVHPMAPSDEARAIARGGERRRAPNVILLFLESWSVRYPEHTPVFEAHRREGLTFEHFYASSVQSSRGRFVTLCSLLPMYREKEVFALADASLHCLPRVMADAGYRTILASASDEPEFERSESFFRQIGFGETHWEDPERRATDPRMWGAGLEDDTFYRELLAMLDERASSGAPIFAVAINASNHYPFDGDPKHVPAPGYPTKYGRNYVASLEAADRRLATFFEEIDRRPALRDSMVVLVGDHSFPADEHGIHFNGLGAREESFRTGFALSWRGHVMPDVVADRTASQIDVAPTIADLAGVSGFSHFVGRSLVATAGGEGAGAVAPMVQPYDGVRLVAVRWPYKLERHEAAQQEHLYDLATDPDEERDRIGDPSLARELPALRDAIRRIRAGQALADQRRIWPPAGVVTAVAR
jgi:arylsulfatase A-like enzyme